MISRWAGDRWCKASARTEAAASFRDQSFGTIPLVLILPDAISSSGSSGLRRMMSNARFRVIANSQVEKLGAPLESASAAPDLQKRLADSYFRQQTVSSPGGAQIDIQRALGSRSM